MTKKVDPKEVADFMSEILACGNDHDKAESQAANKFHITKIKARMIYDQEYWKTKAAQGYEA
jgi:hypothetical protein